MFGFYHYHWADATDDELLMPEIITSLNPNLQDHGISTRWYHQSYLQDLGVSTWMYHQPNLQDLGVSTRWYRRPNLQDLGVSTWMYHQPNLQDFPMVSPASSIRLNIAASFCPSVCSQLFITVINSNKTYQYLYGV